MSTVVVKRPARQPEPEYPSGEVLLDPPPEVPPPGGKAWGQMLMMLPMLAGSVAMALMFAGQRGSTIGYVTGGLFGLSAIGMLASQLSNHSGGPSKQEMLQRRREYMDHLARQRRRVLKTVRKQRESAFYRHPDPDSLWSIPVGPRLWERRRGDADFATVRIGLGVQELATPLVPPPATSLEKLEPMCALALRRFLTTYAEVPDLPVTMALNGFARIHLRGDEEAKRSLVRAILTQAVAFHAPDDMLVAISVSADRRGYWEWAKWLPHALHPTKTDALGALRLVSPTVAGLEAMLDDVLASRPRFNLSGGEPQVNGPHVLVVIDGGDAAGSDHLMTDGGVEGVTIIDLSQPPPRVLDRARLALEIDADGKLSSMTVDGPADIGRADRCRIEEIEALVMQLAPMRLSAASRGETSLTTELGLAELLNLGDPYEFDVDRAWTPRPNRDRLRVPLGVTPDGGPVDLDLKESAQDGMGPHGLLIGATGSGKSELLRTLVLALATTHSSESLNFVLVDFKGGATFTKLDKLPHTSAVITNLADELPLVDRMTDSINGELVRRQELLRAAGNYASQRDYEKARSAGAPLAPLPSLLIICDEFSELLTAKPDFIDMFVQIGRVGRSLGVHLLLASQRLEEGRLRGLDTHLSYRIGLRTFSAMESRVVLGATDAYELPRSPGHGYLRYGTEPLVRFKAAYVSGTYRSKTAEAVAAGDGDERVQEYTTQYVAPQLTRTPKPVVEESTDAIGESLLDLLVGRLTGRGKPAHQVWLPPLSDPPTLDQMLPPLAADPNRGITVTHTGLHGELQVAVGIVDKPFEQRRDVLWLDLAGAAGHTVIVGGPQSGKSTLLRTLVTSLGLTHTPREAQVYCLDLGSGALSSLRDLPHVGAVATRLDSGLVRRTIAELQLLMSQRERRFAERGVDSMAAYRRARRHGQHSEDPFGDIFLVVDGWATIRAEFEDLEPVINDIANRGLSFGVHLAVTASRWMDLRPAIRDVFGTRLELWLADASDSNLDRRAAMNVPEKAPGRGITAEGMQFLAALPRADGVQDSESLPEGGRKLITDLANAWQGPGAPPIRLLPAVLPYGSLPATGRPGIPIGIAEVDLQPVHLDFAADPHFLLFGDGESGKSTFLRALATSIADRHELTEARLVIVDYRRSMLGDITSPHLIGYGSSAQITDGIITEVANVMRDRLPPADVTAEQLRARNWWKGPDLYVLVDDYDLVAGAGSNPLAPLLEFLAQARDIGLHLIIARRTGGASRALYEPVLMRLRELSTPGIVMSGNRDEGVLLGTVRPGPLPPGRGWLVTRREGNRLVQLVNLPPRA
ncbi:type VII secretion protein EccC [Micromonospora polyrhachis]|uniref:S-DNA-T family DNA segregation ATPase FtsK/SpoIIIE n=1 Tax=Micromonospora polyrhachis TaxID=1282883 RepID=A0A7W7WMP0_9ACTN|nr:type VII secretion protein EccCa [Micromonospora polyrhachis]MBB4957020.1 S-DNA-T family DNA segregation ATPase FtsK/SpoIIIE [Micromonospora polyrhachis]